MKLFITLIIPFYYTLKIFLANRQVFTGVLFPVTNNMDIFYKPVFKIKYMKKLLIILVSCLVFSEAYSQNVGINSSGSMPAASAMLDVASNNKGILIPRMTKAQRDAISQPATSLMIYQTDNTPGYYYNAGTAVAPTWTILSTGSGGETFTLPYSGSSAATEAFKILNSNTGTAIIAQSTGGSALKAYSQGNGTAITASTDKGFGLMSIINDTGVAVYGTSQRGNAGKFEISNSANTSPAVFIKNAGNGNGLFINNTSLLNTSPALYVKNTGNGIGAHFEIANAASNYTSLYVGNSGTGTGVSSVTYSGDAVNAYSTNGRGISAISLNGTGLYVSGGTLAMDVRGKIKITGLGQSPGIGKVLTSDANGVATWQNPATPPKVAFRARAIPNSSNSFDQDSWKKVEFFTKEYDLSNSFLATLSSATSATSLFTAPVSGIYHFDAQVTPSNNSLYDYFSSDIRLMINNAGGTSALVTRHYDGNSRGMDANTINTDCYLVAGNKVWIEYRYFDLALPGSTNSLAAGGDKNYFSGRLVLAD